MCSGVIELKMSQILISVIILLLSWVTYCSIKCHKTEKCLILWPTAKTSKIFSLRWNITEKNSKRSHPRSSNLRIWYFYLKNVWNCWEKLLKVVFSPFERVWIVWWTRVCREKPSDWTESSGNSCLLDCSVWNVTCFWVQGGIRWLWMLTMLLIVSLNCF